jgi:hypothetical protein
MNDTVQIEDRKEDYFFQFRNLEDVRHTFLKDLLPVEKEINTSHIFHLTQFQ